MTPHILIAGGGFGGLYAARTLEKRLGRDAARITLVNDVNFMLYTPLLPGAAAGTLEPRHVVVPLREQLKRTELRLGTVVGGDPEARRLHVDGLDGSQRDVAYDHLVVALGSVSRTLPIPGLAEHAIGFKTLAEAIALRNRLLWMLETAEALDDPEARRAYLGFVFVGAGYAGLEGLAELQDFAVDVIKRYPRCRETGMRWVLVEARDQVMPEIPPSLAAFAARQLAKRGIEIRTGTTLEEVGADHARLSGDEVVPARTVAWTAGVAPHPSVAKLGLPLTEGRRVAVDECMRVDGHPGVWAIGDAAAVPDPARPGEPCPPTAQHALRQGRLVARNIAAELGGRGSVKPFTYKTLGVFVDMGRHQAVARTLFIRWRGFPAWFLARTYHLVLMPRIGRRLRLVTDWTVGLVFGRDTSELGQIGHPAYPSMKMTLAERVKEDLTVAMKAGERDRVGALRLILSELQKAVKDGGDDEVTVLRRERKRRREAAEAFRGGDRPELAEQEDAEAAIIEAYLPAELSDDELRAIVENAVRESGAESPRDMGKVMPVAMAAVQGRADGKRVSQLVKDALSG